MISQHDTAARMTDGTVLEVVESELTVDNLWSPYAQGSMTITTPADRGLLDPRDGAMVHGALTKRSGEFGHVRDLSAEWAGQPLSALSAKWGGQPISAISTDPRRSWNAEFVPAQSRPFALFVQERQHNDDGTTKLELASGEAILQNLRTFDVAFGNGPVERAETAQELGRRVVEEAGYMSGFSLLFEVTEDDAAYPIGADLNYPDDAVQYRVLGQTLWDFAEFYLESVNMRLWCDEAGTFRVSHREPAPTTTVALTEASLVVSAAETVRLATETWADHVVVNYLGGVQVGFDYPFDSYPANPMGARKSVFFEFDGVRPYAFPGEPSPARRIYDRMQRRGRTVPLTALSDYTLTPGMGATVTLDPLAAQTGQVQAVTWSFPADRMTLTLNNLLET